MLDCGPAQSEVRTRSVHTRWPIARPEGRRRQAAPNVLLP